jgi:hypothetical protein
MRSGQEHLDPDQAELLLYALGELSEDRQREVDQRLMVDADLRAQLDAIRNDHDMIFRGLSELDASEVIVSSSFLERLVARTIRQRRVDQLVSPAHRPIAVHPRGAWGWIHTAATAASILIGLLLWWGMRTRDVQLAGIPRTAAVLTDGDGASPAAPIHTSLSDIASDDAMFTQAENDLDAVAYLRSFTETAE